ncbi:MAG: class I SAM-dependent methyltransferase [Planctomycetes bacterium]|nr:class I SAM-dependent methyltransferase [Planctomycetota bacterium]
MIRDEQCPFCENARLTIIQTYKHRWISCNNCGNVQRRQKARYAFECLPDFLFRLLPGRIGRFLSMSFKRKAQGEDYYDYYLAGAETGRATAHGTKWEGETERLTQRLADLGVDLRGKSVLDLSGGPGFVAQELSQICRKVVVTEYSRLAVERMRKHLGVDAIRYDYNCDDISELVEEKFDVVLIRWSINFCLDIRGMLASLKQCLNEGAVVYVTFVPPTLGACLRWQFDDYTFLVLYHPETMARLFAEEGLLAVARKDEGAYSYLQGPRHKVLSPFVFPYRIVNRLKMCNQEVSQKNLAMLFQWKPAAQGAAGAAADASRTRAA